MGDDRGVLGGEHHPGRQIAQGDLPLLQPPAVRVGGGQLGLDLVVVDDPALGGVHEEHPTGLETAFADHRGGVDVEHAHLRGEHHQTVVGHPVPRRAKPVAVEHATHHGAVGEDHARGPVPGLHERRVVPVEGPSGRVHGGVVLPRLGDHHEHGVCQAPPTEVQQLEHFVERGGVAPVGVADGEQPLELTGDEVAGEQRLAGAHPVPVPAQRVDLAVVGQVAVGMGERPRREGVGREPRVHEGEPAVEGRVREIGEELPELMPGEHSLVDQGARRQRRHVHPVHLVLDALAQAEGEPVQCQGIAGHRGAGAPGGAARHHHHLGHAGHGPACGVTQTVGHHRDVAPPQDVEALFGRELPDAPSGLGGVVGVGGQEDQPHRVAARFGEVETGGAGQEPVRDLHEDARPVAGGHLGSGGAPVRQVLQRRERLADEPVALASLKVCHQGDPAGVVLEGRVVQGRAGVRRQMP